MTIGKEAQTALEALSFNNDGRLSPSPFPSSTPQVLLFITMVKQKFTSAQRKFAYAYVVRLLRSQGQTLSEPGPSFLPPALSSPVVLKALRAT
jgi:hypothetical protein